MMEPILVRLRARAAQDALARDALRMIEALAAEADSLRHQVSSLHDQVDDLEDERGEWERLQHGLELRAADAYLRGQHSEVAVIEAIQSEVLSW